MQSVSKFPVVFTPAQTATLREWTFLCRWVWNEGLSLLIEHDATTAYNKELKACVPKSPLAQLGFGPPRPTVTAMYCNEVAVPQPKVATSEEAVVAEGEENTVVATIRELEGALEDAKKPKTEKIWAPHSWILARGKKGGTVDPMTGISTHKVEDGLLRVGQCCPVTLPEWKVPRIAMNQLVEEPTGIPIVSPIGKYSLQYYFTQKNVRALYREDWANRFSEMPVWFVRGVCSNLTTAWEQSRKGDRGQPKFKRANAVSASLSHHDGKVFSVIRREPTPEERIQWKVPAKQKEVCLIRIPKMGLVYAKGLERWGDRPIKVLRLVRNPSGDWSLNLTGWEFQFGDTDWEEVEKVLDDLTEKETREFVDSVRCLMIRQALAEVFAEVNQNHPRQVKRTPIEWTVRTLPLWTFKQRKAHTKLQMVGQGFVLCQDDRGTIYTALPKRKDGAVDPHNLIAQLEAQILEVQRKISWKIVSHRGQEQAGMDKGKGGRLAKLYQELAELKRRQTLILENSRKKVAHFISERSLSITVTDAPVEKKRVPKKKIKAGTFDPPTFEPNQAEQVAEQNKSVSSTAPGEFVSLLEREAAERNQRFVRIKSTQEKAPPKKRGKKPKAKAKTK